MTTNSRPDALIVVPPLSPSDTNPPLGPYLLRSSLEARGMSLEVADLSAAYLRRFRATEPIAQELALGDQGKCRSTTHAARAHFIANCALTAEETLYAPMVGLGPLGMHYSFKAIERAVDRACRQGSFWRTFLEENLRATRALPPRVMGISMMGPPQVFIALVLARLCRQWWPETPVVVGGSHITLLISEIASDARYAAGVIDRFLPGHCEEQFAELVGTVSTTGSLPDGIGMTAGSGVPSGGGQTHLTVDRTPLSVRAPFEYLPAIRESDLELYDPKRVTLPMQLTRGCVYNRCTYCTYPAVEPHPDREPDWDRAMAAISQLVSVTGVKRLSFKDSLFTPRCLRELSDRLSDMSLAIEWGATTMLNARLTPGLLQQLAHTGCRTLEFGLETIDPIGQKLFGKNLPLGMVEDVLGGVADAGIVSVLNQILGWPGQTRASAERQLEWYASIRAKYSPLVQSSVNFLEVNRAAPMAVLPEQFEIELQGVAPWAFSYQWDAPKWTAKLEPIAYEIEEKPPGAQEQITAVSATPTS